MNSSILATTGLALLFLLQATPAGAAAPAKAGSDPAAAPRARMYIDGVPDTGQFLPDSFVVCRVGPRKTTVKDYIQLYFDSYAPDRPAPDSAGRVTFLDNIVTKEILGQVALEINRPLGFEDRLVMRQIEQRTLSNALFRVAVLDSLNVTDEQIAREYEQFRHELRLRHILFADRATAIRVHDQVRKGGLSWKQAYDRYSVSKGMDAAPDGDLGWASRGNAGLELGRKVFTLNPGQVSEPVEDTQGWKIFQVVDMRPANPPLLHAVAPLLRDQMLAQLARDRARLVRDMVGKQIGMVYDSTNIAWAAAQFEPAQVVAPDEKGVPHLQFNTGVPEFNPSDTSRVLARHRDGIFTLGRFFDLYHDIQPLLRPNVNTPEDFRDQLDGFAFEPYLADVAVERGLKNDPLVMAELARKREELLVQHLYEDSVQTRIAIDPEARRKYYRDHQKAFITWKTVNYATLWAANRAQADSFAAVLRAGEKAEDILAAQQLLGIDRGMLRTEREDEHNPYHRVVFEDLRPGQVMVTGPDKEGEFLLINKIDEIPGRQLSYDEVAGYIDENLSNEMSERLLKELVDRHRGKFKIMTRPDVVMRIRLVDPTL